MEEIKKYGIEELFVFIGYMLGTFDLFYDSGLYQFRNIEDDEPIYQQTVNEYFKEFLIRVSTDLYLKEKQREAEEWLSKNPPHQVSDY